jgi:type I restriction enzyme, S subunit
MKKGWQMKTLGDLCSFENGDRGENYPSKSVQTTSGVPFINAGHLSESGIDFSNMNYIPRERFELLGNGKIRKDDILFCLRGSLGKFASVGDLSEGAIASSLVIIRPSDKILNEFVLAYLQSDLCAKMIQDFRNGAAQPNLAAASLKRFTIPVPSLAEQQRIVCLLDEAFVGLATTKANAEKNLQNARALFESHLQSVFTQRGPGWVEKMVKEIAVPAKGSIRTGPFGSQLLHSEFVNEGVAVLGIDNVVANEFHWGKSRFITPEKYRLLERYTVHPGDVLITIMGTCGRCAIVPDDIPTAINTKHICCITLDRKQCLSG